MKSQLALIDTESAPELPLFGLSVTIGASEGHRVNPPTLIKPLFDGILSAFHSHNGQRIELVAEILARKLNLPGREAAGHLLSADMAALGVRHLLWPWRDSVQWNPADDRCIAGELLLRPQEDPSIALVGELFEVAGRAGSPTTPRAPTSPAPA